MRRILLGLCLAIGLVGTAFGQAGQYPSNTVPCNNTGSQAPLQPCSTITLGTVGGTSGAFTLNGSTSGNFGVSASATGSPQYAGTVTNDNAPAGDVGEYISSTITSGSAVSLTSGSAATITSINLSAGDWDISGAFYINPAATTSVSAMEAELTTGTGFSFNPGAFYAWANFPTYVPNHVIGSGGLGPLRVSLTSSATYNLVGLASFTVSTCGGYGIIRARRVR